MNLALTHFDKQPLTHTYKKHDASLNTVPRTNARRLSYHAQQILNTRFIRNLNEILEFLFFQ